MKAVVCDKFDSIDRLVYKEVPAPSISENEVLVKIKACGVNFPDTLIVQGLYQFKPPLPFSPGSDIAGIIEKTGSNVSGFRVGDKVLSILPFGGFAEKIAIHKGSLIKIPPRMSYEVAASFMMTYGTSYHALVDRAHLSEGETLLILGASGGVGLAAIELGKQIGAKVIAAASTSKKLNVCKERGADLIINYNEDNLKEKAKELTGGKGVDVVYDAVGGDKTELGLRAMAWNGRLLIVGFPGGIAKVPMNLPLLKGSQIVGVFYGAFATKNPEKNAKNIKHIIELYQSKKISPHISAKYNLKNAKQALLDMSSRKTIGKVLVIP